MMVMMMVMMIESEAGCGVLVGCVDRVCVLIGGVC